MLKYKLPALIFIRDFAWRIWNSSLRFPQICSLPIKRVSLIIRAVPLHEP